MSEGREGEILEDAVEDVIGDEPDGILPDSDEEKEKFQITGHHLRIMVVQGGCDKSCLIYPRGEEQIAVRLCKKCYFDTHRTVYDSYAWIAGGTLSYA